MYRIRPIHCGSLTASKSSLTYRLDADVTFAFPVLAFLLTPLDPEDSLVLVDTGMMGDDSKYMRRRGRTVGPPGGGPEPLVAGLDAAGVSPNDIDVVVLTHLHHDHAANVALFDDAEFFVQQLEIDAASDPLPALANTYVDGTVEMLLERSPRIEDGDATIRDGITVLLTPGHSEGMQSVLVETEDGLQAIVADLAYVQHNLDPSLDQLTDVYGVEHEITSVDARYIPPGTHVDVAACYRSIDRIRARVGPEGTLLASHDPTLVPPVAPPDPTD